jgi:hypothetical protein
MSNIYSVIITFLIFFAAGCFYNNSDSTIEPLELERDPFIMGKLTQIEEDTYGVGILVEENPEVWEPREPGGRKVWFSLMYRQGEIQTDIFIRQQDGSLSESSIDALEIGQTVEGWAVDAVADSYPQQGEAERIVVVDQ